MQWGWESLLLNSFWKPNRSHGLSTRHFWDCRKKVDITGRASCAFPQKKGYYVSTRDPIEYDTLLWHTASKIMKKLSKISNISLKPSLVFFWPCLYVFNHEWSLVISTCRKLLAHAIFARAGIRTDPLEYDLTKSESSRCVKTKTERKSIQKPVTL